MKLATVKSANPSNRDGELVVVSKDLKRAIKVKNSLGPSLLLALRNWASIRPELETLYVQLNRDELKDAFNLNLKDCLAPLPNAPAFFDGSAFLSHVVRARAARGDKMPDSARVTPLMYQGVSDNLLPSQGAIEILDETFGGDFEGEFAVITTDVSRAISSESIDSEIALLCFFNDITLREILKTEIQTKFGFLQSKPNSSFAPIVVTPDEVGSAWKDGRLHLDVEVKLNDDVFGKVHGSEMNFSFEQLIAHAARTRPLSAGTIVGSGTVSNEDKSKGFACLTEKRYQEIMDGGTPLTPWLKPGDHLWMNVNFEGQSLFGAIDQSVVL